MKKAILGLVAAVGCSVVHGASLCAYMTGDDDRHLRYAIADDGFLFDEAATNVVRASFDDGLLRDPHIIKDAEGVYHLCATVSWTNRAFTVWDSRDLVKWENERLVDVAPTGATKTWAPEFVRDEERGDYLVYWTAEQNGDWETAAIWCARTSDFKTFSVPQVLYRDASGDGVLDANITKAAGKYRLVFRRHGLWIAEADSAAGPYANVRKVCDDNVEGPFVWKTGDGEWALMFDYYGGSKGFGLMTTRDFENWERVTNPKPPYYNSRVRFPKGIRHGCVVAVSDDEARRIKAAFSPELKPLLAGFNPDPSICRVGEDYWLVTSSFELFPGLPVYHSRDLRNWELVGHAWTHPDFARFAAGLTGDDGIWAPTIRYRDGTFYICVTWHGSGKPANYILTAKDPRGPWSRPVKVQADVEVGIDGSLFFDDDGKVYYQSNCRVPWHKHCVIWAQEIDVATGRLVGERHYLSKGSGGSPRFAEGPHLYKMRGKYYLLMAQGGTGFDHAASLHVADSVFGPYRECAGNPVLTATDWGAASPLQAFGHADLVDTPYGKWFAVFLGKRMIGGGALCPLGRETFLCPVEWQADGSARFLREDAIAGEWHDGTDTWYSLMTHPEWRARLKKVKSHRETFEAELQPGEAICIYRGGEDGYYARTNETARSVRASVTLDGEKVVFTMDGVTEAPLSVAPLCDQKKRNRFNGLMVGTFRP